jgi:hypothetical protein
MVRRIVLSVVVGTLLAAVMAAPSCSTEPARGIGTSPSEPTADDDPVAPLRLAATVPASCGIWLAASVDEADQAALLGAPPDVLVFTAGHLTCADALRISNAWWSGSSVVRYAVPGGWKAVHAP